MLFLIALPFLSLNFSILFVFVPGLIKAFDREHQTNYSRKPTDLCKIQKVIQQYNDDSMLMSMPTSNICFYNMNVANFPQQDYAETMKKLFRNVSTKHDRPPTYEG